MHPVLQDPYVTASNCSLNQMAFVLYDMSSATTILAKHCRCASQSHELFKFHSTTQNIPTRVGELCGCEQKAIPFSVS